MKNKIIVFFFLLIKNIAFSQKSDVFSSKENTKYQVGIGASKFINNVFPSDENSFLLEVRIRKNDKVHYRFAGDYDIDGSKNGSYSGGIKIGVDKTFKIYKKWSFYYGVDLGYKHNYLKASKKHTGGILVSPFLGIMFRISKNFSISTEPNLYLVTNFLIDNGTFDKDNKQIWVESGLGKVGFLQFNFHF